MNKIGSSTNIAIIGMSALFPGAKNLGAYWENILNKVDAVEDAPDEWAGAYFDPNSTESGRIYTRKGGFLGKLAEFNPVEFGIMPNSVDGGDPDHFLSLKLARDAIADAGYTDKPFNREKTGIILGRGTYINRGFVTALQQSMIVDQTLDLLCQLHPTLDQDTLNSIRQELKSSVPPLAAEIIPTLVPNVVTGRIANRLDLMGPNYVADAACSSSLIAVELAMNELISGRCDMMLAGGVQAATPAPIHMLFCLLGALSHGKIRPFDTSGAGTLLGEGVGFLILKRLEDAQRDGDRIYAVLKGVGTSSDGKALGLLAPRLEGEVLALQRAYENSGIDPDTIGLIEAHGTGIPLGEQTEMQTLNHVFGQRQGNFPRCALGSVKSMIGHCIPAAGVASLIKTALALHHKVLPPMLCDEVNPALEIEKTPFYINTEARPWIHGEQTPRRAGINAFGFGGINAHAILEEYRGWGLGTGDWGLGQSQSEIQQPITNWSTELLIFSGNSKQDLIASINNIQQILQIDESISLANLAYTLSEANTQHPHRLAVIAKNVPELQTKLKQALEKLADPKCTKLQTRSGIYYTANVKKSGKTAFLFPGEGSQYPNMLADLCLYFPKVRAWFDLSDETFAGIWENPPSRFIFPSPTGLTQEEQKLGEKQLYAMDVATEAVFTAGMALDELLHDFGIKCDVMVGHSTGEHTALLASGVSRVKGKKQLIEMKRLLNQSYKDLEATNSVPKGALLSVGAIEPDFIKTLLNAYSGRLHLAMDNCPNQVVLFGSTGDIDEAANQIKEAGGICMHLPFDRATHTPLFEEMASALRSYYEKLDMSAGHTSLYSCATCSEFPSDPETIRDVAIKQWSSRVRFRETIENLYDEGVRTFIEVGPSSNLTGFVDDILRNRDYVAIPSNTQRKSGLEQIQLLLARLFVMGKEIAQDPLYKNRQVTPVNLDVKTVQNRIKKPSPILDLTLPIMQLRPEFAQSIQEKFHSHQPADSHFAPEKPNPLTVLPSVEGEEILSSPNEAKEILPFPRRGEVEPAEIQTMALNQPLQTFENSAVSSEVSLEKVRKVDAQESFATSSETPVFSDDIRLAVVSAHFDLMQEFLASQGRVMTSLFSNPTDSNDSE